MKYFNRKIALLPLILGLLFFCTLCAEIFQLPFSMSDDDASYFEAHFIDVGQADSSLIICDGKAMLIDGGNSDDSNLIYSYLNKNKVSHLDCIVATHAHEDHIGGLAGALISASVDTLYCPVTESDSKSFKNMLKYAEKQNLSITVPQVGDSFMLGSAKVDIIACNSEYDANESSIVLKIIYGDTSFLFTADAEKAAELAILESGYDLKSTVLKVGHHGSSTSTSYAFLREVLPKYAVISVGSDNSYGHPTELTLSKLRDADAVVYRTDMQGDIICRSDGENVTFTVSRNADADTLYPVPHKASSTPASTDDEIVEIPTTPTPVASTDKTDDVADIPEQVIKYILNTDSHKFHYSYCPGTANIKIANREAFTGTRSELIEKGYFPCKRCNP